MGIVLEPLTTVKPGVSVPSYIDATESSTVMAIRGVRDMSGDVTTKESSDASVLFGAGIVNGSSSKQKKPTNPQTVAEKRKGVPTQIGKQTYLEKITIANPAYRICKSAEQISKIHVKKYGKIPKIKKR